MDVRIGIAQSGHVIELELADDTDREELKKLLDKNLADEDSVIWLTDKKGKDTAIPSARVAFVEIASDDPDRRIGFGA